MLTKDSGSRFTSCWQVLGKWSDQWIGSDSRGLFRAALR